MKRLVLLLLVLVGAALHARPTHAASPMFLGTWTITGSQEAPWAAAGGTPIGSDLKALLNKTVRFASDRIVAPKPLGCRRPHFAVKFYAPDMLFQGNLPDPARQAASLGFKGRTIRTLETGCEGAIDFHFIDPAKAVFGLDNRIFVLTRMDR